MIDWKIAISVSQINYGTISFKINIEQKRSFKIVLNCEGIIDSRMARVRDFHPLKRRVTFNRIIIQFHVINFRAKFRNRDTTRNDSRKFHFIIFVKNDVSPKRLSNQLFNKTHILFMLFGDLKQSFSTVIYNSTLSLSRGTIFENWLSL